MTEVPPVAAGDDQNTFAELKLTWTEGKRGSLGGVSAIGVTTAVASALVPY